MRQRLLFVLLVPVLLSLAGCVSVMKTLRLATFNEVLLGVQKEDANKVREAAREGVVFDDGVAAINSSNICGETPLILAIQKNNLEITQILLQEGADPDLPSDVAREPSMCESLNILDTPAGLTPLNYAISRNKPAFAEALLFAGADPAPETADGETALTLAQGKAGFETLVAYLESPVHLAAKTGNAGDLLAAIQRSDDLNRKMTLTGMAPIEEALAARNFYVVDLLAENGGAQSAITSPEAKEGLDEYFEENQGSAIAKQLRELSALP